jgi:hypothetical protein
MGNVTVKVYANGGNLVWSQDFSGNTVLGSIPATITNSYEIDYIGFDAAEGTSIAKFTDPFDPSQPPYLIQALIVVPEFSIIRRDFKTIDRVQAAFESRGIGYAKLTLGRATYDNVAWYARNRNIRYLYIDAHGNRWLEEGDPLRTVVYLSDGAVVSIKRSDYADPNNAPPWCQGLGWYDEENRKSFATMGFDSLEFAYFDCCYSGRLRINSENQLVECSPGQQGLLEVPHSDMSFALGMGETSISRFYQGWHDENFIRTWPFETNYQKWTQLEWQKLGEGEDLYSALYDVIMQQTDFGPDDPVNNYRLKGQGDMMEVQLIGW